MKGGGGGGAEPEAEVGEGGVGGGGRESKVEGRVLPVISCPPLS